MIYDKYLIFTNIMCNNCILSNIYIGTKEGVSKSTPSFLCTNGVYQNLEMMCSTGGGAVQ